jgi:hypothetical protein
VNLLPAFDTSRSPRRMVAGREGARRAEVAPDGRKPNPYSTIPRWHGMTVVALDCSSAGTVRRRS